MWQDGSFKSMCHGGNSDTDEKQDLLLTVPFTASTTNAMEMNKAMTSSVDLRKYRNYIKVVVRKEINSLN